MESATEFAKEDLGVGIWFQEHISQLIAFVMSFVLIGFFWLIHHRMMREVELVDGRFLQLNLVWMLSIVWLPVMASLTGQLYPEPLLVATYIGSLLFSQLTMVACLLYLSRHPHLHKKDPAALKASLTSSSIAAALFAISLVLGAAVPVINYFSLCMLVLVRPIYLVVSKRRQLA